VEILFLDFDGVLHPNPSTTADHFCLLERFESVMRQFPKVRIVIASAWRQTHSLNEIREIFSQDIAARIIGATPELEETDEDEYVRFKEIREYVRNNSLTDRQWIALDDSGFEFPARCDNLVLCNSRYGLDPNAAEALRSRLESLGGT
jgi:hypothetical protein